MVIALKDLLWFSEEMRSKNNNPPVLCYKKKKKDWTFFRLYFSVPKHEKCRE